ncbi:MAG: anaerobic ribonucleoside-triphosphate reductase activating protein [Bacillota bacterium]|nr:anaerobic ribonucleoside-triphosphate reductase activating protein [Bacillota bacterium]
MANSIRIAGIMRESIVDGPGIRFAVFCQGCPHACPGCHNPETHDPAGGNEISVDRLLEEFDKNPLLAGMTFSGGEPMCQTEAFAELGKEVKKRGKTITIFSGYTIEQLVKRAKEDKYTAELLAMCDVLIDGPFIQAERDLTLQFRGSRNQRVIDMNRTRKEGKIVLWEG